MRAPLAAAVLAAAGLLAACGSATVEQETPTSIAPLETTALSDAPSSESAEASASASGAASASESSASASSEPESEAAAVATAQDEGARAISEAPAPAPLVDRDADYLAALTQSGINTEGVEDQLLGVGQNSCEGQDSVTIGAVAGQLIEQGRTQLPHEQVVALITNTAMAAYCG
ncbi:hypothetical protein HMPREF3227_02283 [Corynebacterium sp. CMW7794]|uniref:DUF732 domain-containing protein n=1 Tax=Corynebacterium phoceense TaxID=1686286 RepID=A0A540R8F3_9CORY|nr:MULTISPECIES: DUF732 domain-containing protein [Corynebacterium]KXB51949.1 hypothetical protein HMPREF0307_02666 [Corynebacterium sp. DNF00584]KXI15764.1 hypothetical protein HMPREF3227_02283 [Corynebacterium sp. CMW7794]OFL76251.1 hypothetical protein HMPREF2748_07240 [Corynebacterium sp. HMSC077B05]OFN44976.1 hypothetical protein HMPREF2559_07345 [Corynebacterium sp. HMSC072G08]OFP15695.1 hypothetical protein HMPREF2998_05855 [Corynebacterium sp. HMSC065A05]